MHRTEQSTAESESGSAVEFNKLDDVLDGVLPGKPAGRSSTRPDFIYHRLLAASDVLAILVAATGAHFLADAFGRAGDPFGFVVAVAVMIPVWLAVAYFAGLYHQIDYQIGQDLVDEFGSVLVAITAWAWLFVIFRSATTDELTSMMRPILLWAFVAATLLLFRALLRSWARRRDWNRRSVALIGDPSEAAALAGRIKRHPEWCLDIGASIQPDPDDPAIYRLRVEDGSLAYLREEEMIDQLRFRGIDRTIVVGGSESLSARSTLIRKLANEGIAIDHVVGGPETLYSSAFPQHLEGLTVMSMKPSREPPVSKVVKRGIDVVLSAALLLLALPVLGLSALAIKTDSRGSVIFRQARYGKDGKPFFLLKLRTMAADSDSKRDELRQVHSQLVPGGLFKLKDDPRITPVGKRLRRWSIDEIPQLWNVLIGEMSLVGPRPLPLDEAPLVVAEFKLRERVRPGMTGPWQVMGRSDIPAEDMLRLDYTYVIGWTFAEDLRLLMRTVTAVIGGRGVR